MVWVCCWVVFETPICCSAEARAARAAATCGSADCCVAGGFVDLLLRDQAGFVFVDVGEAGSRRARPACDWFPILEFPLVALHIRRATFDSGGGVGQVVIHLGNSKRSQKLAG